MPDQVPQGAQAQPYALNLDEAPQDSVEVKALKEFARKVEHDRIKNMQAFQNMEKDYQKLEHENNIRRMADINLIHDHPPPILQAPRLVFKTAQEEQLAQKEDTNSILAEL